MQRINKVKDAKRRARKHQQKTVSITTTARIVPDKRKKLIKRAERRDSDL